MISSSSESEADLGSLTSELAPHLLTIRKKLTDRIRRQEPNPGEKGPVPSIDTIIGTNDEALILTRSVAGEFDINHFLIEPPISRTSIIKWERPHSSAWTPSRGFMVVGIIDENSDPLSLIKRLKSELRIDVNWIRSLHDLIPNSDLIVRLASSGISYGTFTSYFPDSP